MKKFITPTYTFTPGGSGVGTVDLSGISGFDVKKLVSIINQTRGVVIYATGSAGLKYTNVTGTTVTLFADTSSHNVADVLQVIYEADDAVTISGGATEAKQDTGNSSLSSIDGKLTTLNAKDFATAANQTTTNTSLSSIDGKLPSLTGGGRVPVDIGGNGSITITSGTITVSNEVEVKNDVGNPVPVSVTSLPLPTGAATESTLSALNNKLAALGQKAMAGSAPVVIASDQSAIPASQSGAWDITNISGTVSLPTGAATSALQTTGNTSLSSIDTKTPSLGQAAMAASSPVVIASDQSAVPVSAASLPLPTGAASETTLSALNTKVPANLTVTATRLLVDGSGVTQPVSAASLPLPSGAATETTLSALNTKTPSLGQAAMAASSPVVIASDQSAVPASQSGTWNINNISGTVSLPTGAATSANQTTANSSLSSIDGKLGSLGQKVMTGSAPVVIASDQSAVPVSAASLPLPTGAATSALQTTGNTSLSNLDGKFGSLGQKAMVGSAPVVIASDQSAIPATQSGTWNINNISGTVSLPTGAATSALQTTANTSLSSIDGKLGSLGQKAMAGSAPVVIASDQSAIPVSAASLPLPTGAASESTLSALNTKVPANLTVTATRLLVDGSGVTQPVSGSVSVSNFPATQNVAVTSALPAGTNNIGDIDVASLPVSFNSGNSDATTQRVVIAANQSAIPVSGSFSVTGGATEAKQDVGNTSLSSIDGKLPALTGGGRVPVDIGGNGSITITSGTITVSNEVEIKNDTGSPVPVSATSLPLPTGAATETTLSALNTKVPANLTVTATRLLVDGSGVTQPISAASLPLPSGAATESTLSALNGKLGSLGQKTMAGSAPVVIASDQSAIPISGSVTATNSANGTPGAAVPSQATMIGGSDGTNLRSVKVNAAGEVAVNVISSALPTGAATESSLSALNAKFGSLGQKTMAGSAPVVIASDQGTLPVSAASLPLPSGAATETTLSAVSGKLPTTLGQKTSANSLAVSIASDQSAIPASQSGTWNINNISGTVSLPTGAATSALQTTGNTSLSNIDTKTPALGQATMAASSPVVIASNQSAIPVSAASLPLPAGAATQTTLASVDTRLSEIQNAVVVDKATYVIGGARVLVGGYVFDDVADAPNLSENSAAAARININRSQVGVIEDGSTRGRYATVTAANAVKVDGSAVTQPVSAASLPLPTGAATETTLSALNTKVPANLTVTATRLLVDGSGVTQPVSAASLPLPTGAATESTLSALNGKFGSLGQKIMTGSTPVVIASDQSAIPASQSGTWNINNISGTVSLPTGAATSANQTTANSSLSSIDNKLTTLNAKDFATQTTLAALLTELQLKADLTDTQPVSVTSLPLPTSAATSALQTTGNTSLASIDGKLPALSGGRVPVDIGGSGSITITSGTITVANEVEIKNDTGSPVPVSAASLPLPTGAATETTLSSINTKLPSQGQAAMAASVPVVIASNQSAVPTTQAGKTAVGRARNNYVTTNVTTGAYVQLVASLGATCNEIEIFDSSGQTLILATGGSGSEVDQIFVFPGGNGRVPLTIASGTRVSIKAVSATANDGEIAINFYS